MTKNTASGYDSILKSFFSSSFDFKAETIRDSDGNMQWNEAEGLLTYRARKIYHFVPELSAEGYKDPDKVFVTGKLETLIKN